jgi:hypothetical protein
MTEVRIIHGLIRGEPSEILGPSLVCADEQHPRNKGRFITGVRLVRYDPARDGLRAEFEGTEWLLVLCEGCLEALVGSLLPQGGVPVGDP